MYIDEQKKYLNEIEFHVFRYLNQNIIVGKSLYSFFSGITERLTSDYGSERCLFGNVWEIM